MNKRDEIFALVTALLASGHYTTPTDIEEGDNHPNFVTLDYGKEWREDGQSRRYRAYVLCQAEELWEEFNEAHPKGALTSDDFSL